MENTTWEQKLNALTHILGNPTTAPSLHSQLVIATQNLLLPQLSKCPYHHPPPLVLAKGGEEAQWGEDQRIERFKKRMRRKRLGSDVNPVHGILAPNMLLFSLLLWKPYLGQRNARETKFEN
ncbi:hypothetical protein PS2_036443 [Malus domestica]